MKTPRPNAVRGEAAHRQRQAEIEALFVPFLAIGAILEILEDRLAVSAGVLVALAQLRVLSAIAIALFIAAGLVWLAARINLFLFPPARHEHPGLEDRIDVLADVVQRRIAEPKSRAMVEAWDVLACSFATIHEDFRRAWVDVMARYTELAIVLCRVNRMLAEVDHNGRIDREFVRRIREDEGRWIGELRISLSRVQDLLGH